MRILYVLHANFERPGVIEDWASRQGFSQSYLRPFAGDKTPAEIAFDILILMGGPQSSLELKKYPYLKEEIAFTAKVIKSGKFVLGFCLGAQIIGEAMGANAERSPHKEVGIYPIKLTKEGKEDPILKELPHEFPVVHWHNDMPGIANGAQVLATSEGCPRQIVRYGERTYGFQCHPEPKLENIREMIQFCSDDLVPGPFVQTSQELLAADYKAINANIIKVLDNILRRI